MTDSVDDIRGDDSAEDKDDDVQYDDEALEDEEFDDDADGAAGATAEAVLRYLARMIVDDPDSVVIETEETRRGVMLRLHVAPDDMGKVIGRRGRVARALRTVVAAAGEQEGINAQVDIVD